MASILGAKMRRGPSVIRLNVPAATSKVPPCALGTGIPRIVHQIYLSKAVPDDLRANVERVRQHQAGWEHRLYQDSDVRSFLSKHYPPEIRAAYARIDSRYGAARADLFRYLLMYKVGGVYLDIKSTTNRPLDAVLREDDRFLLSTWEGQHDEYPGWGMHEELGITNGYEYQQWFIACAPGHPFLKAVIANVLRNLRTYLPSLHGVGKAGVLRLTGPVAYTLAIHPLRVHHPHRVVDSRKDLGLQYSIFSGNDHKQVFKTHYSMQTHSITALGPAKRQLERGADLARHLRNLGRRVLAAR